MGSTADSASNDSVQRQDMGTGVGPEPSGSGILDGVKNQVNSIDGSAAAEFKDQAISLVGEKAAAIKETVVDGAVPAATEALQNVGSQIRDLANGMTKEVKETIEEDPETTAQLEHIDKMDTERLCDFLREKHKSTAPPPETN